ncbi:hypothetical protein [Streptomyces sp. ISL-94]|uniref:hypothetical protein n=1 Tax=Streptomyces sp. ISL-94 TaxID=2819190 RepID=UPI001BEAD2B2|nr:hypothetical protein [Streptomyces sp. ISL-94]MBT2479625.1 hypothetical protein [Streptomyces sp. ISL-94]
MARTSIRTKLAAVAATGMLALGTGVLAAGPAQASDHEVLGCPSGFACIYTEGWYSTTVSQKWDGAGTYNLSNQENGHWVLNNQTQNWKFKLCTGYGGTGSCEDMPLDKWQWRNLTPINSVIVSP